MTPEASGKRRELRSLTTVRFFAAFGVVLYHYARDSIDGAPTSLRTLIESGSIGVTLFFVLSGFILVHVSSGADLADPQARRNFYVRRVARIYPVYLLAWVLVGVVYVARWSETNASVAYAAKITAVYGGLSALLLQSWVPTAVPVWNWPGWSLSVEAFFYALFPFLYPAVARCEPARLWIMLAALIVLGFCVHGILASPTLNATLIAAGSGFAVTWSDFLSSFPVMRLPEFVFGAVLGRLFALGRYPAALRTFNRVFIAAIAAAILALMATPPGAFTLVRRDVLFVPLFGSLVLVLAAGEPRVASGPLRRRIGDTLALLGAASYATYILQSPLWALWRMLPGIPPAPMPLHHVALFIAVLLAVSVLVYRGFERPVERWIKAAFVRRAAPIAARVQAV